MLKKLLPFFIAGLLMISGCGLIPKKVELFQDKVAKFPEPKASEKEIQRQTAQRAHDRAGETVKAAIATQADAAVIVPAVEAEVLTDAVSDSLGSPLHPASPDKTSEALATELRTAIAKLNSRIDNFKTDNNENAGKKIEGTGLFQVPYFVWLGGALVLAFIGVIVLGVLWTFLKMYAMSNPPVQLGVGAVQMGSNFLKRALSEVTAGGEKFKEELLKKVEDPALQDRVKELFRTEHLKAQSQDTQDLLKLMTQKE